MPGTWYVVLISGYVEPGSVEEYDRMGVDKA